MDFNHLRYFVEIVSCQSYTKAAEQLFITQPTLTRAIHQLEEEFDTRLLERKGKNFRLTESGQIFYNTAVNMLREYDSLNRTFDDLRNFRRGEIRICASQVIMGMFLSEITGKFHVKYPDIRMIVTSDDAGRAYQALLRGEIDFAVTVLPEDAERFETAALMEDHCQILVRKSHYLANYDSVHMNKLKDEKVVLYGEEQLIDKFLLKPGKQQSILNNVVCQTVIPDILFRLLQSEECAALIPASVARYYGGDEFKAVEIRNAASWQIGIVRDRNRYRTNAAGCFADFIREHFRNNII